MLQLGLARMSRLVTASQLPWRAVHVAGTNGKGSVCNYTSRMLRAAGVPVGQFTSPHLIDRWDCISLNGQPIDEHLFSSIEDGVKRKDARLKLGATEFEILTATAFEAFSQAEVDVGVVEVGLGGLLDATNVLENPLATAITAISFDHQALLGNSLGEIATQKAGIIKAGAPCFVNARNPPVVRRVIEEKAEFEGARSVEFVSSEALDWEQLLSQELKDMLPEHQLDNLALALATTRVVLSQLDARIDDADLVSAALSGSQPGRLQWIKLSPVAGRKSPALLDGAHNPQSANALGAYVDGHLRSPDSTRSVTWVLAASQGKDVAGMFVDVVKPGDSVVTTSFGPVDGMPWVSAVPSEELDAQLQRILGDVSVQSVSDVHQAIVKGAEVADDGPLVIAGSLYLVSDVLRLLRDK